MRQMAFQAIAAGHRSMRCSFGDLVFEIGVTAEAEALRGFDQKFFVVRRMRRMAVEAFAFLERRMLDCLMLKVLDIGMATEAKVVPVPLEE